MPMRATTIRFSDDLWQLLEAGAERRGISAAQFIREAALLRLGALGATDAAGGAPAVQPPSADVRRAVTDPARVGAVRAADVLDTPATPGFDRPARLAMRFLNAPVALVSIVDADRQFLKSCLGLAEPWASRREMPLSHSYCQHVVASREPLVVNDAREHPQLRDSLGIRDLNAVAYAGAPLIDRSGHVLGTLCVLDSRPRLWSTEQVETLRELAETVVAELRTWRGAA